MITQKYGNGNIDIKVEVAESLEDATKNNFLENEYSRYVVDGKTVSYADMIQSIIKKTHENKKSLIPSKDEIKKIQSQMMESQKNILIGGLKDMLAQYKTHGYPQQAIDDIEKQIKTININGVRDKQ